MPNKMLIDASHQEETRVVVVRGSRIEEFDFESQDKKQLKGNIYLARVTRVEPSLQAAFVEYGGNRHGFLAFSEIHPDYYQIPVADRQALLRAEAAEAEEEDEDEDGEERRDRNRGNRRRRRGRDRGEQPRRQAEGAEGEQPPVAEADGTEGGAEETVQPDAGAYEAEPEAANGEQAAAESDMEPVASDDGAEADGDGNDDKPATIAASIDAEVISEAVGEDTAPEGNGLVEDVAAKDSDDHEVESVGAEDALEEVRNRRKPVRRHYKIQEVIKRRQILLVQVVKEERGNKGAALTTYLSLAGRYSVLMPNTARGGGISRKITNAQDRKRLKEVVADLEVPQGMGVILRTAGESRTKAEIKRDYEYLMRLWENVRTLTLQSIAPALVYEEGSLIKRSVRDLYNKDIDEILVSGDDGYREAKDFMRMLMPSHAKVVQPYRDTTPIFVRSGIEAQLDRMLQPQVTLKSGGYIIINQTEALVAIDVNSGRSTREHSIEETALHTNLEAAEEVARQLRLRDLAGLIVIDFIDMEESRNNRAVEKRLKDHLKNDRARIQVGRISHFGLMEMSRQRIRASVLESTMKPCPHCGGTGHVRSDSSVALAVVRAIEEFLLKDSRSHIIVKTPASTALYVLNHKRSTLTELEARFGLTITMEMDESVGSQHYMILRGAIAEKPADFPDPTISTIVAQPEDEEDDIVEETAEEAGDEARSEQQQARSDAGEEGQRDRKRRRRRRRRGRDRDDGSPRSEQGEGQADEADTEADIDATASDDSGDAVEAEEIGVAAASQSGDVVVAEDAEDDSQAKKRRRGKRGGKRNKKDGEEAAADVAVVATDADDVPAVEAPAAVAEVLAEEILETRPEETAPVEEVPAEKPKRARRTTKAKKAVAVPEETVPAEPAQPAEAVAAIATAEPEAASVVAAEPVAAEPAPRPSRRRPDAPIAAGEPAVVSTGGSGEEQPEQPKKAGWWQRRSFF